MNLYPAMRAKMGRWEYFIVKMNMRELAESVKFAHDIYEDKTLDQAIQRILNESRVKNQIVTYLARQKDRFFASIVIAAIEGNPQWLPVFITDDDRFTLFRDDARMNNTFGVLAFDGTQTYYALDGQHRLAAIKTLIDPSDPASSNAPEGFKDEEISVLVVVPAGVETHDEFLQRYRRLFGHLNRYAKAMDSATNIIMDEDDAFAIITRRLISEHHFFQAAGRQRDSLRIKTEQGKNLKRSDTYFTSIETLYEMNVTLLNSRERKVNGWVTNEEGDTGGDVKSFLQIRPSDSVLDGLYEELTMYWDALLAEMPDLDNDPIMMRNHDAESSDSDDASTDHLLFWPIGQSMLADLARDALDHRLPDVSAPTPDAVEAAFSGVGELEWRLHSSPWRYFLLTQDPDGGWRMRSEDRAAGVALGRQLQEWRLGLFELDEVGIADVKRQWSAMLVPAQTPAESDKLWDQFVSP